jgi:isocitrate/isopropylmalate dehydrogenase
MTHVVSLLAGDGIGPEVALAATRCIEATGVSIRWEGGPGYVQGGPSERIPGIDPQE